MDTTKIFIIILILFSFCPQNLYAAEDNDNSKSDKNNSIDNCILLFYKQKEEAFSACTDFAEDNNDIAQRIIGDMYYWGWGNKVKKNIKQAIKWYKRAVKSGNIDAKYNLGVIYYQGKNTEVDYQKAASWFLSAAKNGNKDAQYNLANMYAKGAGYSLNQRKASAWYLKAANQGDVTSQFNLGNRYALGKGVSKNLAESYKWYYLVAMHGDEEAKKQLDFLAKMAPPEDINRGKMLAEKWRPVISDK